MWWSGARNWVAGPCSTGACGPSARAEVYLRTVRYEAQRENRDGLPEPWNSPALAARLDGLLTAQSRESAGAGRRGRLGRGLHGLA